MIRSFLIIILGFSFLLSAEAAGSVFVAPHRAVYDFQLDSASNEMAILGMTGRMVYELTGSACQGYTTRFRFISRIHIEDMPERLTDQQTTSYEAGDGRTFHFSFMDQVGQDAAHKAEGFAEHTEDGIIVKLQKPQEKEYRLSMAEFPVTQLKSIIQHAKTGHNFYHTTVFDGTNKADRVIKESIVIGEKRVQPLDSEIIKIGVLDGEEYWPVTVSYFDDVENNDGLPMYRTSFLLHESGVMRDLRVDYGTFAVRAKLNSLELFNVGEKLDQCER
ncbi:EipB family protein [Bartonella sp. CB178]|uniref:EipB family protein n=1 Tax=Bartonella sp. CB178 TaxID=3112255 RepID=UPI00300E0FC8